MSEKQEDMISTKLSLPKSNGYYLCLTKNTAAGLDGVKRHFPYNYYYKDGDWYGGDFSICRVDVEYWMDLPEYPDAET